MPTEPYFLSAEETRQIWQQACTELKTHVTEAVFNTWIVNNPLTALELIGDTHVKCTITSPTAFHSTNFKRSAGELLQSTLSNLLGRETELVFKIGTPVQHNSQNQNQNQNQQSPPAQNIPQTPNSNQNQAGGNQNFQSPPPMRSQTQSQSSSNSTPPYQGGQTSGSPNRPSSSPRVEDLFSPSNIQSSNLDRVKIAASQAGLRPDYTFDTFAVSSTNEMAHAAATAVSQRPGSAYNPLFLYGGVGVGKTHLMHAVGHNVLQSDPTIKIIYCTGEEFTNEIVEAIQNKKALRFKDKFRTPHILMIDDIQFIAGKNTVQEEFFHTFNALTQQARQIILTSDRPPHEINLLEDRLRSRFEAGLMVDIQMPSFELRTAILLIKAKAGNIQIPMDLAQHIAAKVDSARKLEGVIKRLRSAVELQNKEINMELIEELLKDDENSPRRRLKVSPNDIIKSVSDHYHVKQSAVRGNRRIKQLVKARHVCMYLIKEELDLPLVEIGRWFSNRDHTTVLHATKKIDAEMLRDTLLQRDVMALRSSLLAVAK